MKKTILPLLAGVAISAHAEPALTIYNADFAVVRDTVPLELKEGVNDVRYSGLTAMAEPDSVILRDPTGKTRLQVLEQSYRNDPVSQELLLSFFEGQTIPFFVKEPNKPDQMVQGKIVRSGFKSGTQPIIEVDGKLRFSLPGQPLFPSLGDDAILNPTLSWKLRSAATAKLSAELAYLTGGLAWESSYNIVEQEGSDQIDLVGWVTFQNQSGKTFENAKVKLMAGDVKKVEPKIEMLKSARGRNVGMLAAASEDAVVTEKAFDEFHLYTLPRPVTLRNQETKQVEFLRATGVKASRIYVYDGAEIPGWRAGMSIGASDDFGTESNKKVRVYREFKNSEENQLGMPLPAGKLRFYRQDKDDQQMEFVGENLIDHTPRNELVRVEVGNAFDLVGERKRIDFKSNSSNHRAEESFEIKVRNRKKEPAEIRVVEHLYRYLQWEIKDSSQAFEKKDAQTIEFKVPLQPDEEKVVTYRVVYTW